MNTNWTRLCDALDTGICPACGKDCKLEEVDGVSYSVCQCGVRLDTGRASTKWCSLCDALDTLHLAGESKKAILNFASTYLETQSEFQTGVFDGPLKHTTKYGCLGYCTITRCRDQQSKRNNERQ